jgi:hypothetical protein
MLPRAREFSLLENLGSHSFLFNGNRSTFPEVWLSRHDVEQLPLSSSEVKNEWSCTSTPSYVFTAWTGIALLLLTFHIRVMSHVVRV